MQTGRDLSPSGVALPASRVLVDRLNPQARADVRGASLP